MKKRDHAQLAIFLISVLDRLAARLDTFYLTMANELLLRPEQELNPARTRWNIVRSKIREGSFFTLCEPLELGSPSNHFRSWQRIIHHVKFQDIITRAKEIIATETDLSKKHEEIRDMDRPLGLAAAHIARASNQEASSFEEHIHADTMSRMSQFMENHSEALAAH